MAYFLIAFMAMGILLGVTSTEQTRAMRAQHTAVIAAGTLDGLQFERFASSMETYIEANPSVGGVLSPQLAAGEFTPAFLTEVTAWVSAPGVEPRTLICSGSFGVGALHASLSASQNDAAFGTPEKGGTQWSSAAGPDTALQALVNPVSASSTEVFVINVQP